jgi:hypothetical protein
MLGMLGSGALHKGGRWTIATLLVIAIVSGIAYVVFHSRVVSTNLTQQQALPTSDA